MDAKVVDAARGGDLAVVRSLVEEQGGDVNEKGRVRYLAAAVAVCHCDLN